jgi:hypothetical protein
LKHFGIVYKISPYLPSFGPSRSVIRLSLETHPNRIVLVSSVESLMALGSQLAHSSLSLRLPCCWTAVCLPVRHLVLRSVQSPSWPCLSCYSSSRTRLACDRCCSCCRGRITTVALVPLLGKPNYARFDFWTNNVRQCPRHQYPRECQPCEPSRSRLAEATQS